MLSTVRTIYRNLSYQSIKVTMADLLGKMNVCWERGVASKDLIVINTSTQYIKEKNCNFIIRILEGDGIKKKGSNIKKSDKKIIDPFCTENRNPRLVVNEMENHTLMLNKFPVLKNHVTCVLVTNEFHNQDEPLSLSDFTAISSIIRDIPSLVFFNCGVDSGASQRHKHIQLIPYTQFEQEKTPIDIIMSSETQTNSICQCSIFDFIHSFIHISEEEKNQPDILLNKYNQLLDDIKQKLSKTANQLQSYNFLILNEFMLIVPRCRETWNNFNVNSLGFAGSFLVKNKEMLKYIEEIGPLTVLKNVVS